jgi:hypothetical protein
MNTKFKVGDRVTKPTGYGFPGTVVSVFNTLNGQTRYVVEMDQFHLLHIFNEDQLCEACTVTALHLSDL